MKAKRTVGLWSLVCLCGVATGATALTYTWTGAVNNRWRLNGNWLVNRCIGLVCYPNSTDDDAIFPEDAVEDWQCDLVSLTIDDLTIQDNVDFGAEETDPVLRVDTVTIVGQSGGTVATINDGAEITTKPAP